MLLFMLLVVAGDVERNPGPPGKEFTTFLIIYLSLQNAYCIHVKWGVTQIK